MNDEDHCHSFPDSIRARFSSRTRARRDDEILDAALARFAELGCLGMNLDAVSASVGIARGTLYLHYGSREALLSAALKRGICKLQARCWEKWRSAPTPAAGLVAVLTELIATHGRREGVAPDVLLRLECGLRWQGGHEGDEGGVGGALGPLVEAWQTAGLIDATADARWVAGIIVALTAPPVVRSSVGRDEQSEQESAERIAALLREGLAPKPRVSDG